MVMKIVLTGGTGFIGQATAEIAKMRGHTVIPLDRSLGHDVSERTSVDAIITPDIDAVIHLAGILGTSELLHAVHSAIDINVHGAANVLLATARADAAYVGITMPNVWPSLYQATKIAGQRIAEAFHNAYGLPVTHIRAFNAYGPGQAHGTGHPQKIIPTFAHNAWRGIPIPIWGEGDQTVDLVHVTDIALRLVLAAEMSDTYGTGSTYDAGSGIERTVNDVAETVIGMVGGRDAGVRHLIMRAGELPHTRLAATEFGPWSPSVVRDELADMGFSDSELDETMRLKRTVWSYR